MPHVSKADHRNRLLMAASRPRALNGRFVCALGYLANGRLPIIAQLRHPEAAVDECRVMADKSP